VGYSPVLPFGSEFEFRIYNTSSTMMAIMTETGKIMLIAFIPGFEDSR
jgi:hypothetical protein